MLRTRILTGIALLLLTMSVQAAPDPDETSVSGGLELGYFGGPGFQLFGMVNNVAREFPMNLRLAIGYTTLEPGKSAEARRVFINDATNGTPEEKGRQMDFRFDLLYPVNILGMSRSYIYGGPRYARFVGNFKYVGGNEDFDVISKQWGVGGGVESYFAMSERVDLVMQLGADFFSKSDLQGHDTRYAPDGDDSNGRDGYTYDDADEAINQPTFEPRLMMGFSYNF